ncbi:DUF4390 domain-containing protein [Thiocapsa marina]|uniref:Proline rich signal peptide protein n=1 Tax=Thiocapsa marina 5811 TaxID=768671 RepID=F9UBR3_9GAMM|nr:DUF4390 domain-containing protein [Thiocapsa marina]EGV18381.1 hypothetical protein ThimaDRAFT_2365 [Thiocapsa marina 5811]
MSQRSPYHPRRILPAVLLLVPVLLLGSFASAAAKDGLRVEQVETRLVDDTFFMDALLDYRFSSEALDALENGVPLTILVQIQVRRVGAWLWEDSRVDLQLRYAIRYKPLSERYEVYRLPGDEGRSFVSRDAAMRALGEIADLALIGASSLDADTDYEIHIRASLDIEELPLPLRPMAYLKPSWKLSSGWSKWPLTP